MKNMSTKRQDEENETSRNWARVKRLLSGSDGPDCKMKLRVEWRKVQLSLKRIRMSGK